MVKYSLVHLPAEDFTSFDFFKQSWHANHKFDFFTGGVSIPAQKSFFAADRDQRKCVPTQHERYDEKF